MYGILEALNRDGMTIVMISHDMRSSIRYGNRILHLRTSPLFCGRTDEYVRTDLYRRLTGGDADDRAHSRAVFV
jgi:zinc transport system ATP-binding protein